MKTVRASVALLCALMLLQSPLAAQQAQAGRQPNAPTAPGWVLNRPGEDAGTFRGILRNYQQREVAPVDLANSGRLESLVRAGILYLSVQDAIALALENNLDIELRRFGVPLAEADLLRAQAGSLLQGIETNIQAGPQGVGAGAQAGAQLVGGGTAGGGQAAQQAVGGTFGGLQIQQIGASIPNLDPVINFNTNWFHQTRPLTSIFTTGTNFLVQDTNNANLQIQQGFLTGGNVTFGFNNFGLEENTPFDRNQLNPSRSGSFRLSFNQPILQGFGIAVNNRFIRIAKNNQKVADLVFKRQVIETVSSVVRLYWDLVSLREEVKVQQQAVELAEKLLVDNRKQVEIGTLAPIEIVRAESQLAQSQQQLIFAETQVLQQEIFLKNSLSRTGLASPTIMDARIIPTDSIQMTDVEAVQPVQDLVAQAYASRPELQETALQLQNSDLQLQGNRSALRPTLNVFAVAQNNALVGGINPNPVLPTNVGFMPPPPDAFFVGGYGSMLSQLFSRNFPDYGVGFQLQIPIRNRNAQANMIQSQLTLRQQQIRERQLQNQIRADVHNALIGLQQARARYQAAVKSRVLNEQTLEAEQKKYALGASTIFLVIQAQRDLAQARSSEVAALSQYSNAQVQMYRSTGDILEKYNVSIDEAVSGRVARAPSPLPVVDQKP